MFFKGARYSREDLLLKRSTLFQKCLKAVGSFETRNYKVEIPEAEPDLLDSSREVEHGESAIKSIPLGGKKEVFSKPP